MHAGRGVDLAQHAQIHLNVAGNGECLVHITAGQHRGGHVLDGEHAGALGNIAGDGAGVGHITNGQAGQIAGDTHLAYLLDGQGERVGAVGLAGEGDITAGIDAGVGHGFLIGSFFPEFNAYVQAGSSACTKGEHAQQQHREQGGAYALISVRHE